MTGLQRESSGSCGQEGIWNSGVSNGTGVGTHLVCKEVGMKQWCNDSGISTCILVNTCSISITW